ncbi:MAG: hypothetical protein RSG96_06580 [Clostridia bacterium]
MPRLKRLAFAFVLVITKKTMEHERALLCDFSHMILQGYGMKVNERKNDHEILAHILSCAFFNRFLRWGSAQMRGLPQSQWRWCPIGIEKPGGRGRPAL